MKYPHFQHPLTIAQTPQLCSWPSISNLTSTEREVIDCQALSLLNQNQRLLKWMNNIKYYEADKSRFEGASGEALGHRRFLGCDEANRLWHRIFCQAAA
jgi:hypothetical protein